MLRTAGPSAAAARDPYATAGFPLVPYSNRIGNGSFEWRGKCMTLARNFPPEPHAIHGVGFERAWQVRSRSADSAHSGADAIVLDASLAVRVRGAAAHHARRRAPADHRDSSALNLANLSRAARVRPSSLFPAAAVRGFNSTRKACGWSAMTACRANSGQALRANSIFRTRARGRAATSTIASRAGTVWPSSPGRTSAGARDHRFPGAVERSGVHSQRARMPSASNRCRTSTMRINRDDREASMPVIAPGEIFDGEHSFTRDPPLGA